MRIYDPRLGRFLSVDPIGNEYPWNSTYAFAEGDPINFIDLDGLERATPPRPGGGRRGGRVTGLNSYSEELANEVGRAARDNRTARERLAAIRQIRLLNSNPALANNYRTNNGILQTLAKENYINNAFNTAGSVFGGGVRDNNKAGDKWDDIVHATMLQNPS